MGWPPNKAIRSRAFSIATMTEGCSVLIAETPGRTYVQLSIIDGNVNSFTVRLSKEQWDGLTDCRYDIECENPVVVDEVISAPQQPAERQIELKSTETETKEATDVPF